MGGGTLRLQETLAVTWRIDTAGGRPYAGFVEDENKEQQDIEAKLLEALEDEPSEMTAADWEGLKRQVAQAGHGQLPD